MPEQDNPQDKKLTENKQNRRDFLKGGAIAAGSELAAANLLGVWAVSASESNSQVSASFTSESDCQPENPYGSRPGGGISLPD